MSTSFRTALVRSRCWSLTGSFTHAETLGRCCDWGYLWSRFYRGDLPSGEVLLVARRRLEREGRTKRKKTRTSRHRRRRYRASNRSPGLDLCPYGNVLEVRFEPKRRQPNPRNLAGANRISRTLSVRSRARREGRKTHQNNQGRKGEHRQEFESMTHSIDYTLHFIHAAGTWHFEGGNLRTGRDIPKQGTRFMF